MPRRSKRKLQTKKGNETVLRAVLDEFDVTTPITDESPLLKRVKTLGFPETTAPEFSNYLESIKQGETVVDGNNTTRSSPRCSHTWTDDARARFVDAFLHQQPEMQGKNTLDVLVNKAAGKMERYFDFSPEIRGIYKRAGEANDVKPVNLASTSQAQSADSENAIKTEEPDNDRGAGSADAASQASTGLYPKGKAVQSSNSSGSPGSSKESPSKPGNSADDEVEIKPKPKHCIKTKAEKSTDDGGI